MPNGRESRWRILMLGWEGCYMMRSNVDPYCGHLWSRHVDSIICPPDPGGDEPALDQLLAGPAEPAAEDDLADQTRAAPPMERPDDYDYKNETWYKRPDMYWIDHDPPADDEG